MPKIVIEWLGHASFKISTEKVKLYIDPWKLVHPTADATIVLVSHSHFDHYCPEDIDKISTADTRIIAPADVVEQQGSGRSLKPGEVVELSGVTVTGIASYNPKKQFHPLEKNWLGFIIEIDGRRIYYAGDTDLTTQMQAITNIDLALLPVGGTYTMNADEAAQAVAQIKPRRAIPYHWGDIVGGREDADKFARIADCEVSILLPGESLTL